MDKIVEYMVRNRWKTDIKIERKLELWNLAKESKKDLDVSHKIGGMLIYNQLIDEFLKDIVEYSIYYIKAEIWPSSFALQIDFSRKTFGQNIELFRQYATIEYNRDVLIKNLVLFNKKRNQVVHNIFDVKDLQSLKKEIDEHLEIAEEIVELLVEYDNCLCEKFVDLSQRVDFNDFVDI